MLMTILIWASCFILYVFIGCIHYIIWDKLFILSGSCDEYKEDFAFLLAISWIISTPFAIFISFTVALVKAIFNVAVGLSKVVR